MRNVIYVAPFPFETTLKFSQGLSRLQDVRLLGVFQQRPSGPAAKLFYDSIVVQNALDAQQVADAIKQLATRYGAPYRILGILENLQEQLAEVREFFGVPGIDLATARRFRDKGVMKDALRAAGVPCARHARIHALNDAWTFADEVGFPIILKPPAGAGCKATYRCDSPQALKSALDEIRPSPQREVLAEEFLTGVEHSLETLTLDGNPHFVSISRYYPSPLEVVRNDWIQWVVLLPRTIDGPEFAEAHRIAPKVVKALGLGTAMTHMEWFRRPDGSVAVGEIGARPPGAQIVQLMNYAYDADFHFAWARLMVDGVVDPHYERKYAVAIAFLRGPGRGRVTGVEGLDEAQKRMGHLVVEAQLPRVGAPKAEGYEGDGWAIVRHPDTEVVKQAVLELITTVKVTYA